MNSIEALKLVLEAADEIDWMLKNGYDRGSEGPPRAHRLVSTLRALAQSAPVQDQKSCKLCTHEQRHYMEMTGPCRACRFYSNFASATPPAQPAVPEGWQPIETAPKDFCTEFDGWNGKRVPDVSWAKPEFNQRGDYAWCVQQYENGYGWANVEVKGLTHWRPIPSAPEKGQP
jgi:hypothetical protein